MNIQVYETNAALGYNEYAYLIKLEKSEHGYDYLCVDTNFGGNDYYKIGEVVKDLEDFYVSICNHSFNTLPLFGSFLFDEFIKKISENTSIIENAPKTIDCKISELQNLTNNFLYTEYYSHSSNIMYKIDCEYTKLGKLKMVLCPVSDGFEKALDLAINQITIEKNNFYKGE